MAHTVHEKLFQEIAKFYCGAEYLRKNPEHKLGAWSFLDFRRRFCPEMMDSTEIAYLRYKKEADNRQCRSFTKIATLYKDG